ncbi:MAG TPA: hypothetical protein VFP84_39815 [Kofleriaceae bacterium]|nr:hypothetical protein [Kofleriaceae bacterium]
MIGFGLVLAAATPALADDSLAGAYNVKFEQVSTNCSSPVSYPEFGLLKIAVKGADMQVDIERTPLMVGKVGKPGKVSVKSKPGHTPISGMDGTFSLAGRISSEGMTSLVMVGEYTTGGKPLCTQTWNLTGQRDGDKAAPGKPKK